MADAWNRRTFVKRLGGIAGAMAFGLGSWSCRADQSDPDSLSSSDLDAISRFAARMFEPEDDKEKQELDKSIRWWAKGRTTRGPHLQLYRDGVAALDVNNPADKNLVALRSEILEGIYSTSVGWKSLGYTTWPGVPSSRLEYTTKPHGPTRVVMFTPLAELVG